MKVGILGSGDVGKALGRGFHSRGHEVLMGTREPQGENAREWAASLGARASTGTFDEAARFGDIAVIATAWSGTENMLRLAGAENLRGKVVIDVTNPLKFSDHGPPGLAIGTTDSAGETVQRWLPGSKVVKAFNIVGNADMVDPKFPGGPPDMFICGDDPAAKQTVTGICESFGWSVIDIGGIDGARVLEPLCILWVRYAIATRSRDHAFKLLRR